MSTIKVLVVGDGEFVEKKDGGINFSELQDGLDETFTISEFIFLLEQDQGISVTKAHRRQDPSLHPAFENFKFTAVSLAQYDVLWLFGYEGLNPSQDDTKPYGHAISGDEVRAIAGFMEGGGGVFATGDHAGMGSFMCGELPRVRTMRKWFADEASFPAGYPRQCKDHSGAVVSTVNWPAVSNEELGRADTLVKNSNGDTEALFRFDDQSDDIPQEIKFPEGSVHPILRGPSGAVHRFPDHMHEGEVVTPLAPNVTEYPSKSDVQPLPHVIATGVVSGGHGTEVDRKTCDHENFESDDQPSEAKEIGILCAYDGWPAGVGRIVTDSSFHHYLDINLIGDPCGQTADRRQGFREPGTEPGTKSRARTTPPSGDGVLADLQALYINTVRWLARQTLHQSPNAGVALNQAELAHTSTDTQPAMTMLAFAGSPSYVFAWKGPSATDEIHLSGAPAIAGASTDAAPALTLIGLGDETLAVCLAWKSTDGKIRVRQCVVGEEGFATEGKWAPLPVAAGRSSDPAANTDAAPALGTGPAGVYAVWKAPGDDAALEWSVYDGKGWSVPKTIPSVRTDVNPALASGDSLRPMGLAWKGAKTNGVWWAELTPGASSLEQHELPDATTDSAPAITPVATRGSFCVAWKGRGRQSLHIAVINAGNAGTPSTLPQAESTAGPALTSFSGGAIEAGEAFDDLILAWKGKGTPQDNIWWASWALQF